MNITDIEMDALREMGNIGVGNATTALSTLIRRRVNLSVPKITVTKTSNLSKVIGGNYTLTTGVYSKISGTFSGDIALLFKREDALRLMDMFLGRKPGETKTLEGEDLSTFVEVGNILANSYVNSIADFFGAKMVLSMPRILYNIGKSLVDFLTMNISPDDDMICIETEFTVETEDGDSEGGVRALFLLLLESESARKFSHELVERVRSEL